MEFDAIADWFIPGSAQGDLPATDAGVRALAAAGVRELDNRLDAAARMHDAGSWLVETATGRLGAELRGDMVAAVIAADHYHAKLPCPQRALRRMRRAAWRRFAAARSAKTLSRFADAMVLWTVMERVPVDWMVPELVLAQMERRLTEHGYGKVQIEGRLASPFPGGAEWVRTECASEMAALCAQGIGGVRAAVLFWPGRTTAAVLQDCIGGVKAHNPRLAAAPVDIQWNGPDVPAGVLLLDHPRRPPAGWFVALCGRLRLGDLLWNGTRKWRLWRRKR